MAPKGEVFSERPRGRMPRPLVPMRGGRRMPGEAAPGNAAATRRGAAKRFGAPAAMRAGNARAPGRGVRGRDCGKASGGSRRPAVPGGDLQELGVDPAGIRSCFPRTGGRPGRYFGTGEAEIACRQSPPEFAAVRSGRRPRRPPGTDGPEAPPGAFPAKDAKAIEKNNPRRTEEDASEQVT